MRWRRALSSCVANAYPYDIGPADGQMSIPQEIAGLALECRNWGRWGDEDQIGTLNHVDGDTIRNAREEIRTGETLSLAIDFGPEGPQINGFHGRFNPHHWMLRTGTDAFANGEMTGFADDVVELCVHGATHWDGLGHVFYEGAMWNGRDIRLVGLRGADQNSITETRDRLLGRGVLVDVAGWKGVGALAAGYSISADDLAACLEHQRVSLATGDFLLIRTGQLGRCLDEGWGHFAGGDAPGLAIDTAPWLNDNAVSAVAVDTWGAEVRPNVTPELSQPWHRIVIPNMGLIVGEMFNLEALAAACAGDQRYTFFLAAPSLPIVGGTGSPVNPIAIR